MFNINVFVRSAAITAIALISTATLANEAEADKPAVVKPSFGHFYFTLGQVSIDSEVARNEGVEDSTTSLRFGYERRTGAMIIGGGISGFLYSDNEGFRQDVEDNNGNRSTAGSSADAFNGFFEGGYSHEFSPTVHLDLLAGLEVVFSSERGIANCSNCRSEDIDINSGLYVMPRIRFGSTDRFNFGLSYQRYLSGDLGNGLNVHFGWGF